MPFEPGNKLAKGGRKDKPFRDALMMEIKAAGEDHKALRAIARAQLEKAAAGDNQSAVFIAERVDGKVPQAVVGDDEHPPVQTETEVIERIIIEHATDTDRESFPATIGTC